MTLFYHVLPTLKPLRSSNSQSSFPLTPHVHGPTPSRLPLPNLHQLQGPEATHLHRSRVGSGGYRGWIRCGNGNDNHGTRLLSWESMLVYKQWDYIYIYTDICWWDVDIMSIIRLYGIDWNQYGGNQPFHEGSKDSCQGFVEQETRKPIISFTFGIRATRDSWWCSFL